MAYYRASAGGGDAAYSESTIDLARGATSTTATVSKPTNEWYVVTCVGVSQYTSNFTVKINGTAYTAWKNKTPTVVAQNTTATTRGGWFYRVTDKALAAGDTLVASTDNSGFAIAILLCNQ